MVAAPLSVPVEKEYRDAVGPERTARRSGPQPTVAVLLAACQRFSEEVAVAATFDAQIDARDGVARVALMGELDMSTTPALEDCLGRCRGDGVSAIILDLRDLSFMDSSGLHAFLRARNDAEEDGHRLHLTGASGAVRKVFELTETQFLLDEPEGIGLLDRLSGDGSTRA